MEEVVSERLQFLLSPLIFITGRVVTGHVRGLACDFRELPLFTVEGGEVFIPVHSLILVQICGREYGTGVDLLISPEEVLDGVEIILVFLHEGQGAGPLLRSQLVPLLVHGSLYPSHLSDDVLSALVELAGPGVLCLVLAQCMTCPPLLHHLVCVCLCGHLPYGFPLFFRLIEESQRIVVYLSSSSACAFGSLDGPRACKTAGILSALFCGHVSDLLDPLAEVLCDPAPYGLLLVREVGIVLECIGIGLILCGLECADNCITISQPVVHAGAECDSQKCTDSIASTDSIIVPFLVEVCELSLLTYTLAITEVCIGKTVQISDFLFVDTRNGAVVSPDLPVIVLVQVSDLSIIVPHLGIVLPVQISDLLVVLSHPRLVVLVQVSEVPLMFPDLLGVLPGCGLALPHVLHILLGDVVPTCHDGPVLQ